MNVRDVMTKQVTTIDPDAPMRRAEALMREAHVRHLPVVDFEGRLVGIITDRDIEHAAFIPALAGVSSALMRWSTAPRVRDLMTWSVITTQPDAPLVSAALTMFERRIGSLPVVDKGALVGILTAHDVLAALGATSAAARPRNPRAPGRHR